MLMRYIIGVIRSLSLSGPSWLPPPSPLPVSGPSRRRPSAVRILFNAVESGADEHLCSP